MQRRGETAGIVDAMSHFVRASVLSLAFVLAACGGDKPAPVAPTAPVAATPEMTATLAKADAKDGAVDKVVHRCAGCALGMDGKAEMPLLVGEFTMHFCKPACLDRYAKDAKGELARLKVD